MHEKNLTAADIESYLAKELGCNVSVVLTDNSSTLISFKKKPGLLNLRLHHMFRFAREPELGALTAFVRGSNKKKARRLREFFRERGSLVKRGPKRRPRLKTAGVHHDLARLFGELNVKYFNGRVAAAVTWGRDVRPKRRLKHIRLGSYDWETGTIRVHPRLDRSNVPGYVVAAVLFHEMCHAHLGPENSNGKRLVHGPEFKKVLSLCPDVARAETWQKRNLSKIMAP